MSKTAELVYGKPVSQKGADSVKMTAPWRWYAMCKKVNLQQRMRHQNPLGNKRRGTDTWDEAGCVAVKVVAAKEDGSSRQQLTTEESEA
jgi:hypothetical protein